MSNERSRTHIQRRTPEQELTTLLPHLEVTDKYRLKTGFLNTNGYESSWKLELIGTWLQYLNDLKYEDEMKHHSRTCFRKVGVNESLCGVFTTPTVNREEAVTCRDCLSILNLPSEEPERPNWDEYYLGIAQAVAARADCTRRKIGAILVTARNRHRGSGYNGGRSGGASCLAGECPRGLLSTDEVGAGSSYDTGAGACIAVHAEQNVILETTPEDRQDGTIYITDVPCDGCLRMLQASGVVRIVWPDGQWVFYARADKSARIVNKVGWHLEECK